MPNTFTKSVAMLLRLFKRGINHYPQLSIIVIITLVYFITGRLGMLMHFASNDITLIWLPTGIAIAALLRCGYRVWPAITLGAVMVEIAIGAPLGLALATSVGSTLGPLLSAFLLNKLKFNHAILTFNDISSLIIATFVGMLVTSGLGVLSMLEFDALIVQTSINTIISSNTYSAWFFYWLGDTVGVFLALPL